MEREVVRLYAKSFIMTDLYMTREDQVFVVHVMVTNMAWEMVAMSVINRLIGVIA
jgi:hypothetical protein